MYSEHYTVVVVDDFRRVCLLPLQRFVERPGVDDQFVAGNKLASQCHQLLALVLRHLNSVARWIGWIEDWYDVYEVCAFYEVLAIR